MFKIRLLKVIVRKRGCLFQQSVAELIDTYRLCRDILTNRPKVDNLLKLNAQFVRSALSHYLSEQKLIQSDSYQKQNTYVYILIIARYILLFLHSKLEIELTTLNTPMLPQSQQNIQYKQLITERSVSIKNHEVEGICRITHIEILCLHPLKITLVVFLSIITLGIVPLFLYWFFSLRRLALFREAADVQSGTYVHIRSSDGVSTLQKIYLSPNQRGEFVPSFKFRYLRFQYNQSGKFFEAASYSPLDLRPVSQWKPHYVETFGNSDLQIQTPSFVKFMLKQLTSPLFFFQYLCLVLWFAEHMAYFAIVILSITLTTLIVQFLLIYNSVNTLNKKLSKGRCTILGRNSVAQVQETRKIDESQVVVGDVVILKKGMQVPCDLLLFSNVVVNEAALTGESVPIHKVAFTGRDFDFQKNQGSILFEGTTVMQIDNGSLPKALAVRTGFSSCKGQMLRQVLFPTVLSDKITTSSTKFVFLITAWTLATYGACLPLFLKHEYPMSLILMRLGDAVTWCIPPTLPMLYQIVKIVSMLRLRKDSVLVKDNSKAFESGQVQTMCFDKTGTITQNKLSISAVYEAEQLHQKSSASFNSSSNLIYYPSPHSQLSQALFANCNTCIRTIQGELIGDPIDLQMIKLLEEASYKFPAANKIRINEFASALCRMSVIVQLDGVFYCFVKGSPEVIKSLASSVPSNYSKLTEELSLKGKRVLAYAYKYLGSEIGQKDMSRSYLESQLTILGLMETNDELKPDSAYNIQRLISAGICCKVVSGDNTYATVQVAREAALLNNQARVQILNYKSLKLSVDTLNLDTESGFSHLAWSRELLVGDLEENVVIVQDELAITGDAFEYLISLQEEHEAIKNKLLIKAKVFGRMKSSQKASLIKNLQQAGQKVGMIGDGPNDCEAIRQANIGISFFDTDSSFAAPFVTESSSLDCIWLVLTEGRCCLASAIEIFRYFYLITLLKFIGVQYLIPSFANFAQLHYVLFSYLLSYPLSLFIAFTGPRKDVLSRKPPDYDLCGLTNCVFIIGELMLQGVFIFLAQQILIQQPWYVPEARSLTSGQYYHSDNQMTTLLFYIVFALTIGSQFVCFIGKTYKKRIYSNKILILAMIIQTVIWVLLVLFPERAPEKLYLQVLGDMTFRLYLIGAVAAELVFQWALGQVVIKLTTKNQAQL